MTNYLKYVLLLLSIIFSGQAVTAQNEEVEITGTIQDEASQQPIEFATIMIGNKETGEAITGTTTGADGTFSINAATEDIYVEISFIGYTNPKPETGHQHYGRPSRPGGHFN